MDATVRIVSTKGVLRFAFEEERNSGVAKVLQFAQVIPFHRGEKTAERSLSRSQMDRA